MLLAAALGCDNEDRQTAIAVVGENPDRGKLIMTDHGCISCHTIPGITGANALVGPPLSHMGARTYIGGVLRNTPDNLVKWIQDPPAVDEKTAMPNLHISRTDARDITTYLYTLQ